MSLSEEEWSEIEGIAYDVANGLSNNIRMLQKLKILRLKHGKLPILLSTEADYRESIDARLNLYKQAIKLCQNDPDRSCLTQSTESIAEIYIEELSDFNNGSIWLNKLIELINMYGTDHILNNITELKLKLNRLKIRGI